MATIKGSEYKRTKLLASVLNAQQPHSAEHAMLAHKGDDELSQVGEMGEGQGEGEAWR